MNSKSTYRSQLLALAKIFVRAFEAKGRVSGFEAMGRALGGEVSPRTVKLFEDEAGKMVMFLFLLRSDAVEGTVYGMRPKIMGNKHVEEIVRISWPFDLEPWKESDS